MGNPRLSGQDTTFFTTIDSVPLNEITAIASFDFTWKFKTTSEEYAGETTPRKDDFYMGVSGRFEYHGESAQGLLLIQTAQARSQNRALSTKIGVKTTLQFPGGGDRAIISIRDIAFGDIQMQMSSRSDYVKFSANWEADDARIVSR